MFHNQQYLQKAEILKLFHLHLQIHKMSGYLALLAFLAENPMRPILERFQTNYNQEDKKAAIENFLSDLCLYGNVRGTDRGLPVIFFDSTKKAISNEQYDLSIFKHIIYAIDQNYEDPFILQTCINLYRILSCDLLDIPPYQRFSFSTNDKPDLLLREVPECYIQSRADPVSETISELRSKMFTCVSSFWDRFFEGKAWSDQTKRIWESYENYKNDSNPKNIPLNLAEQGIWDWIASLNNLFLSQLSEFPSLPSGQFPTLIRKENDLPLRGKIALSSNIGGFFFGEHRGQIDFLITSIGRDSNLPIWNKMRVVAVLSGKPLRYRRRSRFLNMASYVRQIFNQQPVRRFVHGFYVFKKAIEFWLIDRTGAYSSGIISIENSEQALVRAICSYLLMSDEEVGLDTTIHRVDKRYMITIDNEESGQTREIEINPKPIIRPEKLTSCGTTCYRSVGEKFLVKYSWHRVHGKSEIDLLKEALQVRGVINLVASEIIHKRSDVWEDLSAFIPESMRTLEYEKPSEGSEREETDGYRALDEYEMTRAVLSPYGRPLDSCTSVLQFLIVMRDALMGHRGLYNKKIIHSDISEDNIIIVAPTADDRSRGMLIDLDLSISDHDTCKTSTRKYPVGTSKFIALEQVMIEIGNISERDYNFNSSYLYDLESFFYVFLKGFVEYGRDPDLPLHNLDSWQTGYLYDILRKKLEDIESNYENFINTKLSSSFVDVKNLALELRKIMFGNTTYCYKYPRDSNLIYKEMIKAFNKAIGQIEAGKISNRFWT
ncbi:Bgt-20078 [Blumeria graminis f. sp. tritici]|uniref:non-specific serine/threonine protein kinase n=2 Tax=Blumeria graminis f. sp. tritici TaxID=62690 RepID=A0A9X9MEB2_BLUGR|nr:Bgt-20078 [Blumeria graminis f. sp. tritici]